MRSNIIGLLIGCGLAAATVAPALACAFYDQASAEKPQQTAQAQAPTDSKTQ